MAVLIEGGFPLVETDETNFEILKNTANTLTKEDFEMLVTANI